MEETRYDVIFRGKIAEGQNLDEVKQRLLSVYKMDSEKIGIFFSGKTVVVKKNVPYEQAAAFQKTISARTGALFELRPIMASEPPTPPVVSAAPAPIAPKTSGKPVARSPKPTPLPKKPAKRRNSKMAIAILLLLLITGVGVGFYQFGLFDAKTLDRISKGVKNLTARTQQPASTNDTSTISQNAPEAEEVEEVKTLPTTFANAAFSVDIPDIRNGIVPVNDYLDVSWKAKGNLVSPGDEVYEFIVFSMPNSVRFKGAGFLMLPPETTLPFGFKLNDDQLRVLFPLYLLKDATQGAFQVRPLLAGDFRLQWEYVKVNKNGQIEHLSSQATKDPQTVTFEVRDLRPQIIVQDKVGIETPEQVIMSPSGEYEAQVFKEHFQVVYAKNGELIFETTGTNPRFSPSSRFLGYNYDKYEFQVIDLFNQEILSGVPEEDGIVVWGENDSFLIIDFAKMGTLNIIFPFLDSNNVIDNGFFSCNACVAWQTVQFSIDLENALVRFREDGINQKGNNVFYSMINDHKDALGQEVEDRNYSQALQSFGFPVNRKPPKYWEIQDGVQVTHKRVEIDSLKRFLISPILGKTKFSIQVATIAKENETIKGDSYNKGQINQFVMNNNPEKISDRLLRRFNDIGLSIQKNYPALDKNGYYYDIGGKGKSEERNRKVKEDFIKSVREKYPIFQNLSYINAVDEHFRQFDWGWFGITYYYWNNKNHEYLLYQIECQGPPGSSGRGGNAGDIFIMSSGHNHQNYNTSLQQNIPERIKRDKFDSSFNLDDGTFDFESNTSDYFFSENDIFLIRYGSSVIIFDGIQNTLRAFLKGIVEAYNLHALYISQDEKYVLQINKDGHFYIYNLVTQKHILSGVYIDDEIVLYTNDGFYDGTLEGASFVTWHYPGLQTHFNFAQFESQFKCPDIIQALLAGQPVEQPAIKLIPPPTVELVVNHAGNYAPQVMVEVSASSILPLKNMRLFVNGAPAAEIPASGKTAKETLTLDLQRGKQWITAVAYNSRGYSSTPKSVLLDAAKVNAPGGTLHVVGVGVNAYPKMPDNNLDYAVNDVTAFADALKANPNKQYAQVVTTTLLDAQASAANIRQALTETIQQATANDTIMLYFSGHGGKGSDDKFYFLTPDASFDDLEQTGLRWEEVASLLAQAKAKVFVFLDACHSGAASQTTFAPNDAYVAELMKSGKVGMAILASSKGRQSSYEDDTFKHGLFNYAITQAFTKDRKKTDANQDGVIELSELYRSVKFQVNQLSEGDQTPWLSRNEIIGETPLL